jgi:hypothetical protein
MNSRIGWSLSSLLMVTTFSFSRSFGIWLFITRLTDSLTLDDCWFLGLEFDRDGDDPLLLENEHKFDSGSEGSVLKCKLSFSLLCIFSRKGFYLVLVLYLSLWLCYVFTFFFSDMACRLVDIDRLIFFVCSFWSKLGYFVFWRDKEKVLVIFGMFSGKCWLSSNFGSLIRLVM